MKFLKIKDVKTPTRGTSQSAGIDLYIPNDYPSTKIKPQQSIFIPSGLKINVPENNVLIAMNKSGVALKKGLVVGASVVDSDYQGEIHIHLINVSGKSASITPGEKLVQFLLMPVDHCDIELVNETVVFESTSARGSGGFGSTGTN